MNEWILCEAGSPIRISWRGLAGGKGAANDWDGDGQAGGRLEITDPAALSGDHAPRHDQADEGHSVVFALQQADGTNVTRSMTGTCPYIAKVIRYSSAWTG
jgi:hypothetical protein